MTRTELSFPELGLLVGTRGMLGAGLALLLADKLDAEKRRAVGWTLATIWRVEHHSARLCRVRPSQEESRHWWRPINDLSEARRRHAKRTKATKDCRDEERAPGNVSLRARERSIISFRLKADFLRKRERQIRESEEVRSG